MGSTIKGWWAGFTEWRDSVSPDDLVCPPSRDLVFVKRQADRFRHVNVHLEQATRRVIARYAHLHTCLLPDVRRGSRTDLHRSLEL